MRLLLEWKWYGAVPYRIQGEVQRPAADPTCLNPNVSMQYDRCDEMCSGLVSLRHRRGSWSCHHHAKPAACRDQAWIDSLQRTRQTRQPSATRTNFSAPAPQPAFLAVSAARLPMRQTQGGKYRRTSTCCSA